MLNPSKCSKLISQYLRLIVLYLANKELCFVFPSASWPIRNAYCWHPSVWRRGAGRSRHPDGRLRRTISPQENPIKPNLCSTQRCIFFGDYYIKCFICARRQCSEGMQTMASWCSLQFTSHSCVVFVKQVLHIDREAE